MISSDDIEHMIDIAKTDPGMADLLARAEEYYLLKRDINSKFFSSTKMSRLFYEYVVQQQQARLQKNGIV